MVEAEVTAIDPRARRVETSSGGYDYDYLVVSLGAELRRSERVAGLEAPWELDDALAVRERLADFDGGRVVVGVESWPYRCPPAPFEAAMMLRYLAEQRDVSDRTDDLRLPYLAAPDGDLRSADGRRLRPLSRAA